MADQTIADAVVSPGEASDIALRLGGHWRILVRAAHRSSQHDNPTAAVIIIHEHCSGAVRGGDKAPSHQPVARRGQIRHLDRPMQPVGDPLHELGRVGRANLYGSNAVLCVDAIRNSRLLSERRRKQSRAIAYMQLA